VGRGKKKGSPSKEKLALIVWALLVKEKAGSFRTDLKPEPDKAELDALINDGLVRAERRRNAKTRGNSTWIELTDQGWEWAGNNLAAPLPNRSNAGTIVLGELLHRLQVYMRSNGLALVDILDPEVAAKPAPAARKPNNGAANIRQRIRSAYLDTTNGRFNTRALLREIRAKLPDISRAVLDAELKQMQQDEQAILYQLDNRIELTDADRDAALHFAGEPRHILWIER
jgi:hypothetical protein